MLAHIMRGRVVDLTMFALIGALLVCSLWSAFDAPGPPEDEGIALVYPEMFMKGHYPYRDFETIYGPGNLLVLSSAYSIFGLNIFVERAVGLIYRLSIFAALFALAARSGKIIALGVGVCAALLLSVPDLFANTWLAALAFALVGVGVTNTESPTRCFAGGMLAGFAALCRCDLGPAVVLAFLPLFVSMNAKARLNFLAGGALGLLPLVWFAVAVGPGQLVHSLFLFPVLHLSSAAYFPLSSASPELRAFFYFFIAVSIINIVAGAVAWRRGGPNARAFLGASLFGFAAIHYALSRFDSSHVMNAVLVSIPLLPMALAIFGGPLLKSRTAVAIAAVVMAIVALQIAAPWTRENFFGGIRGQFIKGTFVENQGRVFPMRDPRVARSTTDMLHELSRISTPGQRVLVGPGDFRRTVGADTFIYHLLPQLRPGTYYLEMNPGSTNAPGSRLASDIANSDWLILDRGWDLINEPNKSSEYGSDEANEVVRQKFDFWAEYGPYVLMRNQRLRSFLQLPPEQRHQ